MIYHAGFEIDPWMSRFFPIEIGTFVLGMLGRRFYDAYVVHMDRKSCMAFGVSFVLLTLFIYDIAILSYRFHFSMSYMLWPYYGLAALAIPCLFHVTRHSKFDAFLGNFSYPLYLIHWLVMYIYEAFTMTLHLPMRDSPWRILILVALSLAFSWLVIVMVEVPLDRYRQRRYARMAAAPAAGSS